MRYAFHRSKSQKVLNALQRQNIQLCQLPSPTPPPVRGGGNVTCYQYLIVRSAQNWPSAYQLIGNAGHKMFYICFNIIYITLYLSDPKIVKQLGIIVEKNLGNLEFMCWILNELSLAHWMVVVVSLHLPSETIFTSSYKNRNLQQSDNLI